MLCTPLSPLVSLVGAVLGIRSAVAASQCCVCAAILLPNNGPKVLAIHWPKKSCKVLPLSDKVQVLILIRRGEMSYAEVAKIYGNNKSFNCEIVKKEK